MYRVTELKMHNICQYDDVDVMIDVGLMAICGRNGSGKTSLLRGLVYGLTGQVDGSWGSQQALQKDGTADPGWVEVSLSGDRDLVIRRFSVSSPKFPDSVRCGSEAQAVRRKEVDKFLCSIYGVPCSLLFQICWGRQGQMADLLTAPAAMINSFLSALFDMKYVESIREKLKIQLDTVPMLLSACADSLRDAENALNELPPADQQLQTIRDIEISRMQEKDALVAIEVTANGKPEPAAWGMQKQALDTKIGQLEESISSLQSLEPIQEPDVSLQEITACITEARVRLHCSEEGQAQCTARQTYNTQLQTAQTEKISEKDAAHKHIINTLAEKETICRLCKGHIVDSASYEQERCHLLTGFNSIDEYEQAFVREIQQLHGKLAAIQVDLQKDADAIAANSAIITELQTLLSDCEDAQTHAQKYEVYKSNMQIMCQQEQQLADLRAQLAAHMSNPPMSEADYDKLMTARNKAIEQDEIWQDAIQDKKETDAKRASQLREIAMLKDQCEQYETNKEARRILTVLRDILSAPRSQARYLHSKIVELNSRISVLMQQTDLPFTLQLNPDSHTFEYTSAAGYTHPASHLSGAQKNISAVILQMSIFEVLQPQMNLFLVDEPSESLDTENKIVMAALFQRMNRMLPAIDGVMLIVSRDEQLIDSCENVFTIGA